MPCPASLKRIPVAPKGHLGGSAGVGAPTWVALASATIASLACGDGCDSSAVVERLFLATLKAASMAVDHWIHIEPTGEPFKASVKGASTLAALGMNLMYKLRSPRNC